MNEFVIKREFNAPRELVWKVWTEPEHLSHWMTPAGSTMEVHHYDFRVGGANHYCQRSANGGEVWGKSVFREIDPPRKLVVLQSFSDSQGNIARHPMSKTWPEQVLSVSTFEEIGSRTLLTLVWSPYNADQESTATFNGATEGMNQGWAGSFAMLDAYLEKFQSRGTGT